MSSENDPWEHAVERRVRQHAAKHGSLYKLTKRESFALFEIGCFLFLVDDMERQGATVKLSNLGPDDEYRYLTTPSGNPDNFSHVHIKFPGGPELRLRQQVRVKSHLHPDIQVTPDIVLLSSAPVGSVLDPDFASGKKRFFFARSEEVHAVFECKSMSGFPELFVGFAGLLASTILGHANNADVQRCAAGSLTSCLFVGGPISALHRKMVAALEDVHRANIIAGLYAQFSSSQSTPTLHYRDTRLSIMSSAQPPVRRAKPRSARRSRA